MAFNPFRGLASFGPTFDPNNEDHFNALKQHIGFSDEPVQDTDGHWTIGYGQRLSDTPGGPKPAATMSEPFAADMLRQQLANGSGTQIADAGTTLVPEPSTTLPQQPNAKGFLQLPQNVPDSGYYNYGTPGNGAAQFGTPGTIDYAQRVGENWKKLNSDNIGFGNMSLNDGAAYDGHHDHSAGLSIDIRPRRLDEKQLPVNISDPAYDRDATRQLVDTLRKSGDVESILFNDRQIPGVRPQNDIAHDSHLHVRLKPSRKY